MSGDQRLRLVVQHIDGASFEREPGDGPSAAAAGEVRAIRPTAADRGTGVHRYETTVDGWVFEVVVEPAARADLRERAGQGSERAGRSASGSIRAQIPGRVVRLWVEEGDTVESGQRLLAIEAMKMENEVRAPGPGTVEHISVEPGSSVELGDELLTVR